MKKSEIRRKKLIRGIVAGKTQLQAAIDAGYAKKQAGSQASQILKKPQVKSQLYAALDRAGLSDSTLAKKILEWINAQKTVSAIAGTDAGAGTVDFVDVPDYTTQVKAGEMICKMRGHFAEKIEHEIIGNMSININVIDYSVLVKKP